jgi:hypothetical protein
LQDSPERVNSIGRGVSLILHTEKEYSVSHIKRVSSQY